MSDIGASQKLVKVGIKHHEAGIEYGNR